MRRVAPAELDIRIVTREKIEKDDVKSAVRHRIDSIRPACICVDLV